MLSKNAVQWGKVFITFYLGKNKSWDPFGQVYGLPCNATLVSPAQAHAATLSVACVSSK